jgi:hypothetical protein
LCSKLAEMSSNGTVLVDAKWDKLYVWISATTTYSAARTTCSNMQPVPGAVTQGYPVVFNTYTEQARPRLHIAQTLAGWCACMATELHSR